MSGYTLIDRPVTPFSPRSEIMAWVETCRHESAKNSGNQQWADELDYAERLLKTVPDEAAKHAAA